MLSASNLISQRGGMDVFKSINFELKAGQCVEVLGDNGAGKTTLLRTLAKIHTQYNGHFRCDNFLYQGHRLALDELLNAVENLTWHGHLRGQVRSEEQIFSALDRVEMSRNSLSPCAQLSQGQQRRVAMARWLLSVAGVWILDEPVTALDQSGQELLVQILNQHCAGGGAVLYSTHVTLPVVNKLTLVVEAVENQRFAR